MAGPGGRRPTGSGGFGGAKPPHLGGFWGGVGFWGSQGLPKLSQSLLWAQLGPGREIDDFRRGRELSSTAPAHQNKQNGIHPRIQRINRIPIIPRIRCQEPRLGASLPHAPGARMT